MKLKNLLFIAAALIIGSISMFYSPLSTHIKKDRQDDAPLYDNSNQGIHIIYQWKITIVTSKDSPLPTSTIRNIVRRHGGAVYFDSSSTSSAYFSLETNPKITDEVINELKQLRDIEKVSRTYEKEATPTFN